MLHRGSAPADRSEQVNSHDRREVEQGASGGSQAVAETETITPPLTPPQDPLEQPTEVSHHSDVTKCANKISGATHGTSVSEER